ncbi:MAG: hypothetical protein AMXMBFR76_12540 [Pseudomonadota bacterium]
MRVIKYKQTPNGKVLDLPEGETLPQVDQQKVFGIHSTENECIIFESEEEIPEHLRQHPQLHVLRDLPDDMVLWRYMDFPRLYSLITKRSLFFTPACVLREMDPYEFRIPAQQLVSWRKYCSTVRGDDFVNDQLGIEKDAKFDRILEDRYIYSEGISCWHINNSENNALWSIYVPNGGVAIKTTLGRIKSSLDYKGRLLYADLVEYIDYYSEDYKTHPNAEGFEQTFHKAKFFDYEREFRIVLNFNQDLRQFGYGNGELMGTRLGLGETEIREDMRARGGAFLNENAFVPANVYDLIEEVVVGPKLGDWYYNLVVDLVRPVISEEAPIKVSSIGHWHHM